LDVGRFPLFYFPLRVSAPPREPAFPPPIFSRVDMPFGICSHRNVKFALPFLLIVTFALNACTTLANRRDLYRDNEAHGPYTDAYNKAYVTEVTSTHTRVYPH